MNEMIIKVEAEHVGGNMTNTNVFFADGTVIVVTWDAVYVYDNFVAFSELSHSEVHNILDV